MKLSLFTEVQCPKGASAEKRLQELLEQAELADSLGFYGLWISEIHFQPEFSVLSAPYPVLGAIAQRTQRLRLGIAVNLLALHHPLHVAEQAATLDLISHGRTDFALGRGHVHTRIYEAFGVEQSTARARMEESLKVIIGAWTQEVLEFHGNFYEIPAIVVNPQPLQKPHPPVYTAATSPDGVDFAARLGTNLFLTIHLHRERLEDHAAAYWDGLRSYGHDPSQRELGLLVPVFVAETQDKALEQARPGVSDYYRVIAEASDEYRDWLTQRGIDTSRMPPSPAAGLTFERICAENAILGDPATAAEGLRRLAKGTGATHMICWINMGSIPHRHVMRSMELFAREVMPALAAITPRTRPDRSAGG